jgi:hypothetical protein
LKRETQQLILNALNQAFSDLSAWMRSLGVPEERAVQFFGQVMAENGMFAGFLHGVARNILPVSDTITVESSQVMPEFARARSDEYATWLLAQPEPTKEELDRILKMLKGALPGLRQHLIGSAKVGPRHKRGGRPKEIDDPEEREKIREEIKSLRDPGVTLSSLDKRLARRYGVSPTAIKRIRLEKKNQT